MKYFPLKIRFFLLLVVSSHFCLLNLAGDDEKKAGDEGDISDFYGVFKIKNWDKDLKLPEVVDDGKNISREKIDEKETAKFANATGIAGKLKVEEKIRWQPRWKYEGPGGVILPSIAISDDRSLLVVVERTGETKGPNGSRIILIRTADWIAVRAYESNEKKVDKVVFNNDQDELLLVCAKQSLIKQPHELIAISLESGEVYRAKRYRTTITDLAICGNNAVVLLMDDESKSELCELNLETLEAGKRFKSENSRGILYTDSSCGKRFLYAGDNAIEIFEFGKQEPVAKFANPEANIPSSALLLPDSLSIIVSYYGANAYFLREGVQRTLVKNSDSVIAFESGNSLVLLSSLKNDSVFLFKAPAFDEKETFSVSSSKPKTTGDLLFASALSGNKFLFITTHGFFYTVERKGKRWKKDLILEPYR